MEILRTREQLLQKALDYAPTHACATTMREGRAEVLGAFHDSGDNGWIVRVIQPTRRRWLIFVICNDCNRRYSARYPKTIPWGGWLGGGGGVKELTDGDNYDKNLAEWAESLEDNYLAT